MIGLCTVGVEQSNCGVTHRREGEGNEIANPLTYLSRVLLSLQ